MLDDFLIGGEPIDGVELVFAEPSRCLMLFKCEASAFYTTPEAMHLQEEFLSLWGKDSLYYPDHQHYCRKIEKNLEVSDFLRIFAA